jgi:precorrin-2 methylase
MEGERILDSLDQADEASSYFSIIIAGERQPD